MKFYQPLSIDSTKIAVTSTATTLFDLMNEAGSTSEHRAGYPQEANTLILSIEDGSIRVSFDGTSPTASEGLLLTTGTYTISCDLDVIELIRVGGTDVNCSVAIGESINGSDMTASPVSSGGGGGGATLAEQEAQTAILTTIDTDTGNIAGSTSTTATNTGTTATNTGTISSNIIGMRNEVASEAKQDEIKSEVVFIKTLLQDKNSSSYKYTRDTSFVTGDSPVTIDMETALTKNAKIVNLFNDGAGDIDVQFSADGTTYGDTIRVLGSTNSPTGVAEAFSFENLSVSHVKLTWVADTSYRLFYQ